MGFFKSLFTDLFDSFDPNNDVEFDGPHEDVECEDPSEDTEDLAPQELKDAEARVPYSTFVQSCRQFYDDRGFLSAKQRTALTFAGTPYRRARQFGHETDYKGYQDDGEEREEEND